MENFMANREKVKGNEEKQKLLRELECLDANHKKELKKVRLYMAKASITVIAIVTLLQMRDQEVELQEEEKALNSKSKDMRRQFKVLLRSHERDRDDLDNMRYRNSFLQTDIERLRNEIERVNMDLKKIEDRIVKEIEVTQVLRFGGY